MESQITESGGAPGTPQLYDHVLNRPDVLNILLVINNKNRRIHPCRSKHDQTPKSTQHSKLLLTTPKYKCKSAAQMAVFMMIRFSVQ